MLVDFSVLFNLMENCLSLQVPNSSYMLKLATAKLLNMLRMNSTSKYPKRLF